LASSLTSQPGAALPSSFDWAYDVVLSDGSTARVRPLCSEDAPQVTGLHQRLSPETRRLRYFGSHPVMSEAEVEKLLACDGHRHMALGVERKGRLLAVAQYDRLPGSEVADVAFVVEDAYHGVGVGTLLLEYLASEARRYGIKRFRADVLFENEDMLGVFRDAGFAESTKLEAGEVEVVLDIAPTGEALAALYERDKLAAARSVQRLLEPRSVAVIGASRKPGTVGHEIVRNLVNGKFQGPVYPVNPAASHVASLPAFASVEAVPGPVDLAVVAVPAKQVADVVAECGRKGVRSLVVVSSHFAEDGPEGAAMEREVARLAHSYGMRMVGPNCFGVLNTAPGISMNATFAKQAPSAGHLGFASQSGGLGIAILAEATKRGVGLSNFVSMGNKADVSGNDLLAFWSVDPRTKVGLLYLESFGNPRKFARLARQLSREKPLVAIKGGRSAVGGKAAASHTAALASPSEAVEALFLQTGVIGVATIEELFDVAQVVASQPLGEGMRVGVLSNVGGVAVLAVDACEANGLVVPELSVDLQRRIREVAPGAGGTANPVDLGAEATAPVYEAVLEAMVMSGEIDAALVNFTPPLTGRRTSEVAAAIAAVGAKAKGAGVAKPMVASLLGAEDEGREILRAAPFPVPSFTYPETAVRALAHALRYARWRRRPEQQPPQLSGIDVNRARLHLPHEPSGGLASGWVTGTAAMDVLSSFGVPVARTVEVFSPEEAAKVALEMGGPLALKVLGPLHKSEGGGVRLQLRAPDEVGAAFVEMQGSFGSAMRGALLQPMAPAGGVETIVGVLQDRSFGPMVLFGLGGVAVEALGDHVTRLAPLTELDALEMVEGLRGSALLGTYRGRPAVDKDALVELVLRVSRLAEDLPEVAELDLNPVIVSAEGVLVLDARLKVEPSSRPRLDDTRHLR
jgi:acetyl coenzyme A synthetase (ADP forming)-like protein